MSVCWAVVHHPCAGLMFKTVDHGAAAWSSEKGGTGWRFDTPGSGDEHPKLVQNPEPLTSHRILTDFWENCGYLIQAYIMHL